MNTDSRLVTPSLFLGRPSHVRSVGVTTVERAIQVIRDGGIAALPRDAIEMVRPILEAFGASDEHIESRLKIARDGNL